MQNIYLFSPVATSKFSEELLEATTINYCPPLDRNTRVEFTGLTRDEVIKFLPAVISVSSTSPDFLQKVEEYYREFSESIPYKGKTLDATIGEDGLPVKPTDYLLYKIVSGDKTVAKGEDTKTADGQFFTYKLESISNLKKEEADVFGIVKAATLAYSKLINAEDTPTRLRVLKAILLTNRDVIKDLGIDDINNASRVTTEIHLKTILDKKPQAIIDAEQDKDITMKAYVELFIDFNLVTLEGEEVHYEGTKLANNRVSLISVLKSNNTVFASLQGRLRKEQYVNNLIKPVEE